MSNKRTKSTSKARAKVKSKAKAKVKLVKKETVRQPDPIYTAEQELDLLKQAAGELSQPMNLSSVDAKKREKALNNIIAVHNSINEKHEAAKKKKAA